MKIEIAGSLIMAVLLMSVRLSALLLLSPLFSVGQVPARVRVLLVVSLAAVMTFALQPHLQSMPSTLAELLLAAINELILGAALAFGIFSAFGAFMFGGRLLDFQMGFGVAALIDPATRDQSPLMGTVLNIMAVTAFFLLNGHHLLIKGLAYGLVRVPLGTPLSEIGVDAMLAQFGLMFVYGVAIVAPAVIALLLVDVGMAIAARTMPQVNMFIVGLPIKIFVGLLLLTLSLGYMGPLLERIYESIFRYWQQILDQVI